jgi:hypothetical protein
MKERLLSIRGKYLSSLLLICFIFIGATLSAQVVVKGKVADQGGNAISGVSVTIKSTDLGTTTNGSGFFRDDATAIPIYLPGEMLLIQAEGNARANNLPNAVSFLNQVLTKTTDAFSLGANQPAYSGGNTQAAILQEIYRNRCMELYMSGMKLEDSRRFGRPGPGQAGAERTRNFYPYPQQERDGNPNTPTDPAN